MTPGRGVDRAEGPGCRLTIGRVMLWIAALAVPMGIGRSDDPVVVIFGSILAFYGVLIILIVWLIRRKQAELERERRRGPGK